MNGVQVFYRLGHPTYRSGFSIPDGATSGVFGMTGLF